MTKHTPAPWKYEATSGAIFMDDGDVEALIASTNLESVTEEQGDADGRLIAAAPELLDALKEALMLLLHNPDAGQPPRYRNQQATKVIKAAIAKAEGGAA